LVGPASRVAGDPARAQTGRTSRPWGSTQEPHASVPRDVVRFSLVQRSPDRGIAARGGALDAGARETSGGADRRGASPLSLNGSVGRLWPRTSFPSCSPTRAVS